MKKVFSKELAIKKAALDVLQEQYGTPEKTLEAGWLTKNTCWRLVKKKPPGYAFTFNCFEIELATRNKNNSWIAWGALTIDVDDFDPKGFRSITMGHVRICSPDAFERERHITEIRGHLEEINEQLNKLWPYPEEKK
jgi:hypothetical protein